jgi:hypothetical protein
VVTRPLGLWTGCNHPEKARSPPVTERGTRPSLEVANWKKYARKRITEP